MASTPKPSKSPARERGGAELEALSEAIESGAGLPAVARAAAKALEASIALIDRSSAVLAVAALSNDEEGKLLSDGAGVERIELRVGGSVVGELRYRPRGGGDDGDQSDAGQPGAPLLRTITTLLALELERTRAPEWASESAAGDFVNAVLAREVTDRGDLLARAAEVGSDLSEGGGVLLARAVPHATQSGDWRSRVLTLALRSLRALSPGALAAEVTGSSERAEVIAIVPADRDERLARAAEALSSELGAGLAGFAITVARSRLASDPVDLHRSAAEARLAANVAEADGVSVLAFEDTGAYRLLLPVISEDPAELERFYEETVAPLAAYDEQYDTELLVTVEAYLEHDGNVAATAQRLFTHRHTVRYRLERARDLCGHDVTSTEGREKLGLGLKAMRVLGISPPRGPAREPGAEGGNVSRNKRG